MDAYRQRLNDLILSKGTLKDASLAIGRNHAYFHQFLNDAKPKELKEGDRHKLADYLVVS